MKSLKNQSGNAAFYMIWLLGFVGIGILILTNIIKIYVVKEQSSISAEQAAFAGTAIYIEETKEAIENFDDSPKSAVQKAADGGKTIEEQVNEEKERYMYNGYSEVEAYIQALNKRLPKEVEEHPLLKDELNDELTSNSIDPKVLQAIQGIIQNNEGNVEDATYKLSRDQWRLEVKSTATFSSVADGDIIERFLRDIPQKGYGPSLTYLKDVIN